MHNNKHVVKMILETAQLLSTAHRVNDGYVVIEKTPNGRNVKRWCLSDKRNDILYKATHVNHPSAVWVRFSKDNYDFTYQLFCALLDEYTYRYGKIHKTSKLKEVLADAPHKISYFLFEEPPKCMPDYCKIGNAVDSYREYYLKEKSDMLQYTKRETPSWITNQI